MEIINNKLIAKKGYLLKDKKDNGQTLDDGTFIPPYLTDVIYLAKQIDTLEKARNLYEEVEGEKDE